MGTSVNGTAVGGGGATGAGSNVATAETTSSATYAALATAQTVSVTVGASGRLLIAWNANAYRNGLGDTVFASVALSGANTVAASDTNCATASSAIANGACPVGRTLILVGLTPGPTTVTLQWKTGGATWTIERRSLVALPC